MASKTKAASGGKQEAGARTNAAEKKDERAPASDQTGQAAAASAMNPSPAEGAESAIDALEQDHRRVEQLFADYESASEDARKDELVQQICIELVIHARLEEQIFYPACREKLSEKDMLDEAQVEHDSAKLLIADLMEGRSGDRFRDAKVSVLREQVKHHVGEEEMPGEGILAQARANGVDSADLARRLKERKQTLQGRAAELRPTRAISLNLDLDTFTDQEGRMARNTGSNGGRERDERGRFVSDDDDRDYRRPASRGGGRRDDDDDDDRRGGSRSRGRNDDDDRGGRVRGGWFGDSEGHREAARRRFDDDDDRRGSRSRERDDDEDDDRGGRGRGWFGDSEGHREAARRRFEDDDDDRRSSRSRGRDDDDDDRRGSRSRGRDDDDDDRRGSRSRGRDDDDDGRGSRSRGRDDDDDGRGGRGRGGWFGDSEGHAEAARRRLENEGGRGSRSRSRDDEDDDRRSRSRGRSDEGHGGWFGDSRGHAQAARRGWESRR